MNYKEALREYYNFINRIEKRRKEVEKFSQFLEKHTNWLTAPASTRYHLPIEGGLLIHSVGVCKTLLKLKNTLAPQISDESCIICALFHDVGKVGMPEKPLYLKNENNVTGEEPAYIINENLSYSAIAMRSVYLIARYIPLSEEELQAILYHDGLYIPEGKAVSHKEEALTLLLHWADYWTAHILEDKFPIKISDYFQEE